MEEKDLIAKIQTLKNIKPSQDWVVSVKANVFKQTPASRPAYQATFSSLLAFVSQKKMAYSLASLLVVAAGVAGFMTYGFPTDFDITKNSTASISSQEAFENFKVKSQSLAFVATDTTPSSSFPKVLEEVKEATKTLTKTVKKDPELARKIALDVNNSKSLLDVRPSDTEDLKETTQDLYKEIDEQMIKDFKKTTLTAEQKMELERIEAEFKKGTDYGTVLRDLLFLSASAESKDN